MKAQTRDSLPTTVASYEEGSILRLNEYNFDYVQWENAKEQIWEHEATTVTLAEVHLLFEYLLYTS